jgi:hypothetical protein
MKRGGLTVNVIQLAVRTAECRVEHLRIEVVLLDINVRPDPEATPFEEGMPRDRKAVWMQPTFEIVFHSLDQYVVIELFRLEYEVLTSSVAGEEFLRRPTLGGW